MNYKFIIMLYLLFIASSLGCFPYADIQHVTFPTAVLNEYYEVEFTATDGWTYTNYWERFSLSGGDLPNGLAISDGGALYGTPAEVGSFDFLATFSFEDAGGWSDPFDDDYYDSEWFTVFVTEASTNVDCPMPSNEESSLIYLCLGTVEEENLNSGEGITLDVNYFVNLDSSQNYDIDTISFVINFDSASFVLDDSSLNEDLLREAADITQPVILFDTTEEGQLGVTLTAVSKSFVRSGRILDIPFYAMTDLPQPSYEFPLTIISILSTSSADPDATLPEIIGLDGILTLSDNEEE